MSLNRSCLVALKHLFELPRVFTVILSESGKLALLRSRGIVTLINVFSKAILWQLQFEEAYWEISFVKKDSLICLVRPYPPTVRLFSLSLENEVTFLSEKNWGNSLNFIESYPSENLILTKNFVTSQTHFRRFLDGDEVFFETPPAFEFPYQYQSGFICLENKDCETDPKCTKLFSLAEKKMIFELNGSCAMKVVSSSSKLICEQKDFIKLFDLRTKTFLKSFRFRRFLGASQILIMGGWNGWGCFLSSSSEKKTWSFFAFNENLDTAGVRYSIETNEKDKFESKTPFVLNRREEKATLYRIEMLNFVNIQNSRISSPCLIVRRIYKRARKSLKNSF